MRLIDADALEAFVKTVRQGLYLDKTLSDMPTRDSMLLNFQQYVHLQPTSSAVPVVRCSECISHGTLTNGNLFCGKRFTGVYGEYHVVKPDDYCSYGKRREK